MISVTFVVGTAILACGVVLMFYSVVSNPSGLQNMPSKISGAIVGSFLCVLGIILMGIGLDILEDLDKILERVWRRFLEALGR